MPPGTREDPLKALRFSVEIDGIAASAFSAVSGIDAEVAVIDYRSGSDKGAGSRKLPGEARFGNIVLQRGLTQDLSLWQWMLDSLEGRVNRKNMSVVLQDDAGKEVLRFNFREAWPVRWSGPTLDPDLGDVALETIEIAHEGLSVTG